MPAQEFSFEPKGPIRLQVAWGSFWKEIVVVLDGKKIDTFSGQKALIDGREYVLEDGTELKIRLKKSILGQELLVTRDGKPLPGSSADPVVKANTTTVLVFFMAFWNIVFGGLGWYIYNRNAPEAVPYQIALIVEGVLFIGLGLLIRKRSLPALAAVMVVFVADTAYTVMSASQAGQQPSMFRLLLQALILYYLYQGWQAFRELRADPTLERSLDTALQLPSEPAQEDAQLGDFQQPESDAIDQNTDQDTHQNIQR